MNSNTHIKKELNPFVNYGLLILFVVFILFLQRILFVCFNLNIQQLNWAELTKSFWIALRFDFSVIALLFGPIFIVIFLISLFCKIPRLLNSLAIFLSFLLATFFNFTDAAYFPFAGKRIDRSIFVIWDDIKDQFTHIVSTYWFVIALVVLFYCFSFVFIYKFFSNFKRVQVTKKYILSFFAVVVVFAVGIRGGFQGKPLSFAHAFTSQEPIWDWIKLNSFFTLYRSKNHDQILQLKGVFNMPEPIKGMPLNVKYSQPQNVVVILMESMGSEYIGKNNATTLTPFLNSLKNKSYFKLNALAGARTSIMAPPSITCAFPGWLNSGFIGTPLQSLKITCLPEILRKEAAIQSAFFVGVKKSSMGFDNFSKRVGFDVFEGKSEILNKFPKSDDGVWGVFDHKMFEYVAGRLNTLSKKSQFFTLIKTHSNHNPYLLPKEHENFFVEKSKKLRKKYHDEYNIQFSDSQSQNLKSVLYADYSLEQFFKNIKKQPWYSNTLFILTGDHSSPTRSWKKRNSYGDFNVPFIMFHPSKDLSSLNDNDILPHHIDITPSILDFLNLKSSYEKYNVSRLGQSLFRKIYKKRIFGNSNELYFIKDSQDYKRIKSPEKFNELLYFSNFLYQ